MRKTIILSDNEPCEVRILGLFELDSLHTPLMTPFVYTFEMIDGSEVEAIYDPFNLPGEPPVPDVGKKDCEVNSIGWHQWLERETYEAAISHWEKNYRELEIYADKVSLYIYERCLEEMDKTRIVAQADWHSVMDAALVPQVTEEVLADTLRNSFPGDL